MNIINLKIIQKSGLELISSEEVMQRWLLGDSSYKKAAENGEPMVYRKHEDTITYDIEATDGKSRFHLIFTGIESNKRPKNIKRYKSDDNLLKRLDSWCNSKEKIVIFHQ